MPRGRMLSRSISTSISISSMSEWAQLLFDRVVIWADDHGLLEGDPRVLKATLVPLSERSAGHVARAIAEMITAGVVEAYIVGGRSYLHVARHEEHQRVDKQAKSRYPLMTQGVATDAEGYIASLSGKAPDDSGKSLLREEKRREVKGREENTPCSPPQAVDAEPKVSEVAGERKEPVAAGEPEPKRTRKKTATRMTLEWQPSAEWITRLTAEYPVVDIASVVSEFRLWWIGDGRGKADWNATLANRVKDIHADIRSGNKRAIAAYGRGDRSDSSGTGARSTSKKIRSASEFGQRTFAADSSGKADTLPPVQSATSGGSDDAVR